MLAIIATAVVVVAVFLVIGICISFFLSLKSFNLSVTHVLITGGSSGFEWSLALEVVKWGASVTLLAREEEVSKVVSTLRNKYTQPAQQPTRGFLMKGRTVDLHEMATSNTDSLVHGAVHVLDGTDAEASDLNAAVVLCSNGFVKLLILTDVEWFAPAACLQTLHQQKRANIKELLAAPAKMAAASNCTALLLLLYEDATRIHNKILVSRKFNR